MCNVTGLHRTRIRVVSALGRFGLGRFGQFLGWVVSVLVGGSFRPIFEASCINYKYEKDTQSVYISGEDEKFQS